MLWQVEFKCVMGEGGCLQYAAAADDTMGMGASLPLWPGATLPCTSWIHLASFTSTSTETDTIVAHALQGVHHGGFMMAMSKRGRTLFVSPCSPF
jgi:hypothetical protein